MRPLLLTALCVFAGLTCPAHASSDASELPNPFTDQPAATANVTNTDNGLADPAQNPAIQPLRSNDYNASGAQGSAPASSGGDFYQATKKDTDGR